MLRRLAPALLLSLALVAPAVAQAPPQREEPGRITVTGVGETRFPPDIATITVGVLVQASASGEAMLKATRAMTEAAAALRQAGIEPRDLQTSSFNVSPQFETSPSGAARMIGVQVSASLAVRVRRLDRLGEILDRVVALGANSVSGPDFGLADERAARDGARRAAAEDATRRARLMAEAMGVRLGRIVSIEESGPGYRPRARGNFAPAAAAAAVPVEAGEESLEASVTVVWEIAQ